MLLYIISFEIFHLFFDQTYEAFPPQTIFNALYLFANTVAEPQVLGKPFHDGYDSTFNLKYVTTGISFNHKIRW